MFYELIRTFMAQKIVKIKNRTKGIIFLTSYLFKCNSFHFGRSLIVFYLLKDFKHISIYLYVYHIINQSQIQFAVSFRSELVQLSYIHERL